MRMRIPHFKKPVAHSGMQVAHFKMFIAHSEMSVPHFDFAGDMRRKKGETNF